MPAVRVALVGASGETGTSIVNGLFEAGGFVRLPSPSCMYHLTLFKELVALTRPASVSKPANQALKQRGVEIRPVDLRASQETLVEALKGIDVVISAITAMEQLEQIPLATAAKTAGVKRFVPCGFITVCPPGGVMSLRDSVCGSSLVPSCTQSMSSAFTYSTQFGSYRRS